MGSSPLLVASAIVVALVVVQFVLITLRNAVRNRLFPGPPDASCPVAVGASAQLTTALPQSTRQARQPGDPSIEE